MNTSKRTYREHTDCVEWVHEFNARFPGSGIMNVNGYQASVMFAERLASGGEADVVHPLPAGVMAPAYPVSRYEACPDSWRKQGDAFFIPIPRGEDGQGPGMWYDWRAARQGEFEVAVVPSTTGLNPLTGQKADALRLERYVERCPVHEEAFLAERFCERCHFAWPPQNYVCEPNTLWWDGFRRPDGEVRQFFFSDDVLRDVGVASLGKDRVPAFGFAFFLAKEERPRPVNLYRGMPMAAAAAASPFFVGAVTVNAGGADEDFVDCCAAASDDTAEADGELGDGLNRGTLASLPDDTPGPRGVPVAAGAAAPSRRAAAASAQVGFARRLKMASLKSRGAASMSPPAAATSAPRPPAPPRSVGEVRREAILKTVAVGAGARISQDLEPDPKPLSAWHEEPAAITTVYFVPEEVAAQILEGPQRDLVGDREGFVGKLPVQVGTE